MPHRSRQPTVPRLLHAPADDLCLGFANTLAWRGSPAPTEALGALPALLDWLADTRQPPSPVWSEVADLLREHPKRAARLFTQAIALREAIFRCCFAVASSAAVPDADLDALNQALADMPPRRRLVRDHRAVYAWADEDSAPLASRLLAPVLWSAADLLARADQVRVRRCANDKCLWLFIDRSKTGSRRWCDMAACGNRAKAQRHYRSRRPAGCRDLPPT